MPLVSEAQRKAMWAAENGHSTLGIPKEVATKFLTHDFAALAANSAIPAGVRKLAVDADTAQDMTEEDWRGLIEGLVKFFAEERQEPAHDADPPGIKHDPKNGQFTSGGGSGRSSGPKPLTSSSTPEERAAAMKRSNESVMTVPRTTGGHASYDLPDGGSIRVKKNADGSFYGEVSSDDMGDHDFEAKGEVELRAKLAKYKAKHAGSSHKAMDAAMVEMAMDRSFNPSPDSRFEIAMDEDSVREKTRDGRLIVKRTHVTKANVCPYRGKEIPGWEELGLEPDRVYNLLRDPDELAKAAPSLNGVQLLIKHVPVNAEDHRPNDTVGSLGSDAEWDGEYLDNSLFVNARHAIDAIESGKQKELSAGYHYKPDMTPGNFRGTAYDGVMRDIVFNHVALVEDGRAGPDVVVGDEALKENDMATKATRLGARTLLMTAGAVAPLLAMDSKVTLPSTLFRGLTTKNFKDKRTELLGGVKLALDGKLRKGIALDSSIEKFGKALDAFIDDVNSGMDEPAPEEASPAIEEASQIEAPKAIKEPGSTYDAEPLKGFLRDCGMDEEKIAKAMDMMPKPGITGDSDEDDDEDGKKKKPFGNDEDKDKDMVDKPAMDAALAAQAADFDKRIKAVRDTERAIRMALDEVRPWIGELPATMAFDSAADVHRKALEMKGDAGAKTLHADALMPILKTYPKIGARTVTDLGHQPVIAMDAVEKATKLAPDLAHISTSL